MNPEAKHYISFLENRTVQSVEGLLEEHFSRIPVEKCDEAKGADGVEYVVDVGCGTGRATKECLLPCLSGNEVKITALDISKDMIRMASDTYPDSRIDYIVTDIEDRRSFPSHWQGRFSRAFSFYCLHWLQDLNLGFRNIASILRPGGYLLATFVVDSPVFDAAHRFKNTTKWGSHCTKSMAELINCESASKRIELVKAALENAGFQVNHLMTRTLSLEPPSLHLFKECVRSLALFYSSIPDDLKENYVNDYAQCILDTKGKYSVSAQELVALAYKDRCR